MKTDTPSKSDRSLTTSTTREIRDTIMLESTTQRKRKDLLWYIRIAMFLGLCVVVTLCMLLNSSHLIKAVILITSGGVMCWLSSFPISTYNMMSNVVIVLASACLLLAAWFWLQTSVQSHPDPQFWIALYFAVVVAYVVPTTYALVQVVMHTKSIST